MSHAIQSSVVDMTEINAFGYIEVIGFVTAIEAADAMVKSANVRIYTEQGVDPAMISVIVEGDLAACRAAVNAGVAAAERIGKVVSHLVHGRPSDDCAHLVTHLLKQSKDSNWQINTLTPKSIKPELKKSDCAKTAANIVQAPEKVSSVQSDVQTEQVKADVLQTEILQVQATIIESINIESESDSIEMSVVPAVAQANVLIKPATTKRKSKKPSAHHHK